MPEDELRLTILDAIIDCPSSPFVLMLTEVRRELARDIGVMEMLCELRAMREADLITSSNDSGDGDFVVYFDNAELGATADRYEQWFKRNEDDLNVSWDPFGLWFEITDVGRLDWHRNLPADYVEPLLWRSGGDATGHLVIYAQDEECVARALESWALTSPNRPIDAASRVTEPLPEYVLNINRVIRDGIRVTFSISKSDRLRQH
jgi:hypothetical protein